MKKHKTKAEIIKNQWHHLMRGSNHIYIPRLLLDLKVISKDIFIDFLNITSKSFREAELKKYRRILNVDRGMTQQPIDHPRPQKSIKPNKSRKF